MRKRHRWHEFDVETGMEARRTWRGWQVRDRHGTKTRLTADQFEQLRQPGANPKGLQ